MRSSPVWIVIVAGLAGAVPAGAASGRAPVDSAAAARLLVRWAREAVGDGSIEQRQRAVRDLRRSIELCPRNPEAWLLLGQVHEIGGSGSLARQCFRKAVDLAPRELDGWMELSRSWKRAWLRTLDPSALDSSVAACGPAAALRPRASTPWLGLVPLLYEQGQRARAVEAADRACRGYPRRSECALAAAYTMFREGDIDRADSLFAVSIPMLHPTVRRLFEKPDWIGLAAGGTGAATGSTTPASPWDGLDPDPTTPANELELEYWSRVAHAYLLFFDPLAPELDARAETYVRYGPPARVELNPRGAPVAIQYGHIRRPRYGVASSFPVDAQVWSYPDLGMRIVLQDRTLTGRYYPAVEKDFDPASMPDPRVLAARVDWVPLGGGIAAFPTLPPREQRLDVIGSVARFEGARGPRLVAHVEAPGGPSDSLWGRWVVFDSTGREIAHAAGALGVSACDASGRRLGAFTCDLPPGAFDVFLSARDRRRRRGLVRTQVTVPARPAGLALSDIVLSCGDPSALVGGSEVRLDANVTAIVPGSRPLAAYFEIYRLAPGSDGRRRFEYDYAVRPASEPREPRRRRGPTVDIPLLASTSGEEEQLGPLRRQFLSVPTQSLRAGAYRLEVRVRDVVAGTTATGSVAFRRE